MTQQHAKQCINGISFPADKSKTPAKRLALRQREVQTAQSHAKTHGMV